MVHLALIGCGYWGRNYVKTVGEIGDAQLKVVCDLQDLQLRIPPGTSFTKDYRTLINDPDIRGVIIATPTVTHYRLTKEFLKAGKHVLVEKPISTRVSEAEELCSLAKELGAQLLVGEIFRFHPAVRYVKDLIAKKEIGELRYIESRRIGLGPIRRDVSVLWDLASHDIYIANLLMGKRPDSISYQGISHNGSLDDIASLNVKYEHPSVLATIYVNWEHPIKERKLIVGGTKKSVLFDDVEVSEKVVIYDRGVDYQPPTDDFGDFMAATRDGDILIPKIKFRPPLEEELRHFIACIEGKEQCFSDGYAGLLTVKVLEAAEASRKNNGMEVKL